MFQTINNMVQKFFQGYVDTDVPLAFLYALVWIPSLICLLGLHYYGIQNQLSLKWKAFKIICLCIVLSAPLGFTLAAQSLLACER